MLCNKLLQNSSTWNNKYLSSPNFCSLANCLCIIISHKAGVKLSSRAAVNVIWSLCRVLYLHLKAWLGRICFQGHLCGCWLDSVSHGLLDLEPQFFAGYSCLIFFFLNHADLSIGHFVTWKLASLRTSTCECRRGDLGSGISPFRLYSVS